MSGGNSNNIAVIGLAAAAAFAVAALLIDSASDVQLRHEKAAQGHAQNYADHAAKELQRCITLSPESRAQCENNAIEARREGQRNEYDLEAQRITATWTQYMGIAAIIGIAVSIIGVGLVWTTFAETRLANEIAKGAAEAAERDARSARDALILANRAIISLSGVKVWIYQANKWWDATFHIKNSGKSNAHQIVIEYKIWSEPVFPEGFFRQQRIQKIVVPGDAIDLPSFSISAPSEFPCYLIGSIRYSTIHDTEFETFFCRKINGPPGQTSMGDVENHFLENVFCPSLPRDT